MDVVHPDTDGYQGSPGRVRVPGRAGRRPFWLVGLGLMLVGVVALMACSGGGEPAPDFSFNLYRGQEVLGSDSLSLSDLQGKPTVLNFWAGLCPPCRLEMPDFQRFYDQVGDQVNLIGVDVGPFVGLGSRSDAETLVEELDITYPTGYALDAGPVRQYQVLNMPTTVFITEDGRIFRTWSGLLKHTDLVRIIQQLDPSIAIS